MRKCLLIDFNLGIDEIKFFKDKQSAIKIITPDSFIVYVDCKGAKWTTK